MLADKVLIENVEILKKTGTTKELINTIITLLDKLVFTAYSNNFIFVYGSLRKDQYNYDRIRRQFGDDSFIHIDTLEMRNVKMYDLGEYPAVTTAKYEDIVVGDLMYCSDEAYKFIKAMELGAGYVETTGTVLCPNNEKRYRWVVCYYYKAGNNLHELISKRKFPKVESGNWVKYLHSVQEVEETEYYYD